VKNHIAAPWAERLDAEALELVDTRFVTKDFKDKEADIIYRARIEGGDAVFYVHLEMQSEPDFTMPFRLLVYMTELLRRVFAETEDKIRRRKDFRLPAVVPIVLYNGSGRWSCVGSFKEYLASYKLFVPNVIDFEYILIDINAPAEARLLKTPTLVNLAMLADRKGDPERVLRRLGKVLKLSGRLTQDEQLQLGAWVSDVILRKAKGKIDAGTARSIGKAFERKEETQMTYAIERAMDELERRGMRKGKREGKLEGERKGKLEGRREGKLETAMAMLGDGLPLETASKYTGIPTDELARSLGKSES
jgi:predicted transposase/invertase (TIGR01784 family)